VAEEATLGQAAGVAGFPQAEFLRGLVRHRIPFHYGGEELVEDLRTVAGAPMIVVSDTSPLTALLGVGAADILPQLSP